MTLASDWQTARRRLRGFAAFLAALWAQGCALSDDYHVDSGLDGGAGGSDSSGPRGGPSASTSASTGGGPTSSSSGGSDGTGGSESTTSTTETSNDATGSSSSTGGTGATGSGTGGSGGSGGAAGSGGSTGTGGTGGGTVCDPECNAGRECSAGACDGGWLETSAPPGGFSPREQAAYVSIGNELFIWGGLNESGTALGSGALYDPRTDTWTMISDVDAPSPRSYATAVWTGALVVVFGGFDPGSGNALVDGGVYDPVEDEWLTMATPSTARSASVGMYGQGRAVFWGGEDDYGDPIDRLVLYNPDTDGWRVDTGFESPGALEDAATGAGEQTFWVFGGRDESSMASGSGWYYSLNSYDWSSLGMDPLAARWGAFGAFADASFVVWGGRNVDEIFSDGARYQLGGGFESNWTSVTSMGAPSARYRSHRESGWTVVIDDEMWLIGGLDDPGSYLKDGGIYSPSGFSSGWTDIEAWPGSASHAFGVAEAVAGELVVWGGRDGDSLTNTGVRYLP